MTTVTDTADLKEGWIVFSGICSVTLYFRVVQHLGLGLDAAHELILSGLGGQCFSY